QGELQGALTSLSSITTIVGPLIFTQMFSYFTRPEAPVTFAGAPYLTAAVLILLAAGVFLTRVRVREPAEALEATG
ncbi:tetracycline resistance MFS efflux pump, partial [Rhizobium sp. PEPV16]